MIKTENDQIVCQVIDHSIKEDKVFQNRTGGYYTKPVSASKTVTAPYDKSIQGTVSKAAFLFEYEGVKVYALNAIASMNKTKFAFVR